MAAGQASSSAGVGAGVARGTACDGGTCTWAVHAMWLRWVGAREEGDPPGGAAREPGSSADVKGEKS
jgi:hypothetical protein